MKPAALLDACVQCYKSYNPNKVTMDSHLEYFIAEIDCTDEGHALFIKQVVYGCIRYKKLNKVVLTALYFKHGTEVSREDYHLYMIFSYLTLIRLEDISIPVFRKFVFSQDAQKMFVWLTFIFNAQTLNKWMKDEWCRIFDEQYVEDELIARLIRNLPEVSEMIEKLREIASTRDVDDVGNVDDTKQKLPATRIEPFNLSRPRPRMVPEPFPIKLENPYKKPIPKSLKDPDGDGTLKKVEEARQEAKEKSVQVHAKARAPDFETAKLAEKKVVRAHKFRDNLVEEAEKQLEEATRYLPPQASDPKAALKAAEGASVRLNAAAVLREGALLQKKQREEASIINKYESELRDDSEFYEWQAKMRDRDQRTRLEEVERRRVQMLLTDENAREAKIQNQMDNQRLATEMRYEVAAIKELGKAEREQTLLSKKQLVEDVKESEKNVKPAVEAVVAQKMMAGMELRDESKKLEEDRRQREAEEEAARMDVVRQIRAMESVPVDRNAHFDPTSVSEKSNHVLEAMSMAELLQRLQMVKTAAREKEEQKRREIVQEKQLKEDDMLQRLSTIQRVRQIRELDAKDQRRRKIQKEEDDKAMRLKIRQEAQAKLQEEIEKKRRARLEEEEKLQKEMQQIEIKKQFLAAGAAQVEEKKFKELETGAERKLKDKQARERYEHQQFLAAMQEDEKNRRNAAKAKEQRTKGFLQDYDTRFKEGVAAMADALATAHTEKRQVVALTRDRESALRDHQITADPNKHLVNTKSILSARPVREARLGATGQAALRKTVTV
eukprot:CAMPEP_0177698456 /NCGR_PEP_ID=MMETSP0484_2-20121128/5051_1 /TAXON_ID=354590 /ORGANISM="Rhodomonas lens, Strain RHODO" /LENGTH=780 /DNA_ID=CAMNT_0019209551 /DNA_START=35 /DNA_END=2374 /DNA_ORIENTATION=+